MITKTLQIYLIAFVLLVAPAIKANYDFKIEDYIPQKFKDLSLQIGGNVKASVKNSKGDPYYDIDRVSIQRNDNSNYSGLLSTQLKYRNETLKEIFSAAMSARISFESRTDESFRKFDEGIPITRSNLRESKRSRKNSSFRISPSSTYQKYFENDMFYSVSLSSSFDYNFSLKDKSEQTEKNYYQYNYRYSYMDNYDFRYYTNESNVDSRRYQTKLDITIGNGRIYAGKYAFAAHNIIDALKKEGLVNNLPNKNIMIELTDIIYQYENKHIIDSRLRKIEKYDAIYSFLLKSKIVTKDSHLGMLHLQDAYEMFPREYRRFGFSKRIGVGLRYSYNSSHRTSLIDSQRLTYHYLNDSTNTVDTTQNSDNVVIEYSEYKNESLGKYVVLSLSYGKPLNMKWQVDASATGRFYFDSYEKNSNGPSYDIENKYDINTYLTTDYFYSSRTIWRTSFSYSYSRFKSSRDESIPQYLNDRKRWNFNISTKLDYRISIPTTLSGQISYRNSENKDIRNDTINFSDKMEFNFSLSLSHYIY